MTLVRIFSVCLAVFLAGCNSVLVFPMARSTAVDAAKVRIINGTKHAAIYLFRPEQCEDGYLTLLSDWTKIGGLDPHVGMLAPPNLPAVKFSEYSLVPGQLINVGANCLVGASFVVEANQQYEILFMESGHQRCSVAVSNLVSTDSGVRRIPFTGARPMVCKKIL